MHQLHQVEFLVCTILLGNKLDSDSDSDSAWGGKRVGPVVPGLS